ncbi:hypothetical protein HDU96_005899, partial [Phlyctochytrium bullatum]
MIYGPYCASFPVASANTQVTWPSATQSKNQPPFLGLSISVNLQKAATVTFGTAVQAVSGDFPGDLNTTVMFAGYLEYGAFSITIDPSDAEVNNISITTPELFYDQALTIKNPSQISLWNIGSRRVFYVTSIDSPVPRLRCTIQSAGSYVFLAGVSQAEDGQSTSYGDVRYLASWGQKTYTFPRSSDTETQLGTLSIIVTASSDFVFNVRPTAVNPWSPGGLIRLVLVTITVVTSPAPKYNMTLVFKYNSDALVPDKISPRTLTWG